MTRTRERKVRKSKYGEIVTRALLMQSNEVLTLECTTLQQMEALRRGIRREADVRKANLTIVARGMNVVVCQGMQHEVPEMTVSQLDGETITKLDLLDNGDKAVIEQMASEIDNLDELAIHINEYFPKGKRDYALRHASMLLMQTKD